MDQTTPIVMEKKSVPRPWQQSNKLHAQDNKDVKKKSNKRRQQRELERENLCSRKKSGGNGGAAPAGRAGFGWRLPSQYTTRSREKDSGQVGGYEANWSRDDGDEEFDSEELPGNKQRQQRVTTHHVQSWSGDRHQRYQRQHRTVVKKYNNNNKERHLQARCQFVVNVAKEEQEQASARVPVGCAPPPVAAPASVGKTSTASSASSGAGDVAVAPEQLESDPDALVSWSAVEEVFMHMTQPTHCPVCLYPPVAPQVTKCGHIYCYPCILHYLALSDKKWRTCPICDDSVVRSDLKSVVCVVHPDHSVGSSIEMTLMKRDRESMIPKLAYPPSGVLQPMLSRKMRATKTVVANIITRERTALDVQMSEEGAQPEACFIEQALSLLSDREQNLQQLYPEEPDDDDSPCSDASDVFVLPENMEKLALCDDKNQAFSNSGGDRPSYNDSLTEKKETVSRDLFGKDYSQESVEFASTSSSPVQVSSENGSGDCRSDSCSLSRLSSNESLGAECPGTVLETPLMQQTVAPRDDSGHTSASGGTSSERLYCALEEEQSSAERLHFALEEEQSSAERLHFALEEEHSSNRSHASPNVTARHNVAPKPTYYFYQASDGSHVYLHGLNLAMLTSQYGSVEQCPASFTANIIEKEYSIMDATLRQRTKYLRHVPVCCPYDMVEVDLQPPTVTPAIVRDFQSSLSRRQAHRAVRAKEERLIERRNEAKQERELSGHLFKRISSAASTIAAAAAAPVADSLLSDQCFPEMRASDMSAVGGRRSVSPDGASSAEPATGPSYSSSADQQLSFAKMVRVSAASPRAAWSSLGGVATGRGASWPQAARGTAGQAADGEDDCSAPSYSDSFSQGFDDALLQQGRGDCPLTGSASKKGKKGKKKQRQVLLFSSGF